MSFYLVKSKLYQEKYTLFLSCINKNYLLNKYKLKIVNYKNNTTKNLIWFKYILNASYLVESKIVYKVT